MVDASKRFQFHRITVLKLRLNEIAVSLVLRLKRFSGSTKAVTDSTSSAWARVNHDLATVPSHCKADRRFWWSTTGATFAVLLEKAGYTFEEQYQNLSYYANTIIPELGNGPRVDGFPKRWQSFMSDHHSPIEFSWEWNIQNESPVIRFSFEPIGSAAGTPKDPYNQFAALLFVEKQHAELPDCDLSLFRHFWNMLVHFDDPKSTRDGFCAVRVSRPRSDSQQGTVSVSTHQSRAFLALEFNKNGVMLKAYFMPEFKARAMGCTVMDVVNNAIKSFPGLLPAIGVSYGKLLKFMASEQGQTMCPEIVAVDCVAPKRSRIKIYMRSQLTTLESVIETLSLSISSERKRLEKPIEELKKVWALTFSLPQGSTAELPPISHRTGGILYYIGLMNDDTAPTVKVYLPVRHYAKGDTEAATGLQNYIRSTARKDYSDRYVDAIDTIMKSSYHHEQKALQTYYTVALKGNGLRLTSYLSPAVYGK